MGDFPSFLPTHLSLLRLPQSLAGPGEAGGGEAQRPSTRGSPYLTGCFF